MKSERLSRAYEIMKEMSDDELFQLQNTIRLYITHTRQVEHTNKAREIWNKAKEILEKKLCINLETGRDMYSVKYRRCLLYKLYYKEVKGITFEGLGEASGLSKSSVQKGIYDLFRTMDYNKQIGSAMTYVEQVLDEVMGRDNE